MVEVRIRAVVAVTDEAAVLAAARTGQAGVTPYPNLAPRAPVPAAVAAVLDPAAGLVPGLRLVDRSVTAHTVGGVDGVAFAELFPPEPDDELGWCLTPRTAAVLHTALTLLADHAYDDVGRHGDKPVTAASRVPWMVFDRLPRLSWRCDTSWRRRIARAFDDLRTDLECGQWPIPRCNGEELALHLAIEDAPVLLHDQDEFMADVVAGLPTDPGDCDWERCSEMLFQDHDILLLADASVDGIDDPTNPVNQMVGLGDLRPDNWFTEFRNVDPRDPRRGFRR